MKTKIDLSNPNSDSNTVMNEKSLIQESKQLEQELKALHKKLKAETKDLNKKLKAETKDLKKRYRAHMRNVDKFCGKHSDDSLDCTLDKPLCSGCRVASSFDRVESALYCIPEVFKGWNTF